MRAGIVVVGWLVGWWLLWRVPPLRTETDPDGAPASEDGAAGGSVDGPGARRRAIALDCSVVIPARDEERSLTALLASLAEQTVRPGQVVVVDDQSTDATPAIAAGRREVTLVRGRPLPDGWTGKAWACRQGVDVATGETLVFLDADVVLEPGGLEAVLSEHADRGGLVSVQPFHRMRRAYERLSAMFGVIGFMGVGAGSPGRDGASRGAFGPVLVTSRADYELAGSHDAVRAEIAEDLALARRYRAAGLPVHAFGGGRLARFRMYPGGLGQLVEGWSKNIATGAGTVAIPRLLLIGFWVTCVLVTVQSLIEVVVGAPTTSWPEAVACYVLVAVQLAVMLRQLGNFGMLTAALYPVAAAFFLAVFVRSTYLTLVRRRVTWRGRSIPLAPERRRSRARVVDG